jgi:hypothetical protein
MACIRDDDFHPPDEVRLFPMPTSGVWRLDDEAFLAAVRYGDIAVRHYAFRDHWFNVNCTTDPAGAFVDTTSPDDVPLFRFNCAIATPMLRQDEAVFAVDLWPDVLVRADGVTHGVHDHGDFDAAIGRGWLSAREAEGARSGLRELVELIERRELVAFLAGFHPFDGAPVPAAPDEQRVPLSAVPLLRPEARPRGRRGGARRPSARAAAGGLAAELVGVVDVKDGAFGVSAEPVLGSLGRCEEVHVAAEGASDVGRRGRGRAGGSVTVA